MRKAKRTFINTPKANVDIVPSNRINEWDFTHKGLIVDHENRMVFVLATTDAKIRQGDEDLVNIAVEVFNLYPKYRKSILSVGLI